MNRLKQALTSAPILSCPRPAGTYILYTDASGHGIGAVLSQEQDGEEKVILYYSRTLSKSEAKYCATRKELLAVVEAVRHCHHYLIGQTLFKIRTDQEIALRRQRVNDTDPDLSQWIDKWSNKDLQDQQELDPESTTPPCPVEYIEGIRDAALEAFQTAKDNLQKNAERQKRNYDRGAVQRQFAVGDWVLRLYPPNMSKSKLNPKYIGPYLITAKLSEVTYRIQRTSKSAPIPVHADHLKRFFSEKLPDSWLPSDDPLARTREQSVQTVETEGEPETADDATTDNSSSSDSASCMPDIPEETPRRSSRIRRPPARFGWDSD
nr:hypothetical protein BaRGS_012238 [Batillaria attramentaria]